jgi:hypothetical protein
MASQTLVVADMINNFLDPAEALYLDEAGRGGGSESGRP